MRFQKPVFFIEKPKRILLYSTFQRQQNLGFELWRLGNLESTFPPQSVTLLDTTVYVFQASQQRNIPVFPPGLFLYVNLVAKGAQKLFKTLVPQIRVLAILTFANAYSRTLHSIRGMQIRLVVYLSLITCERSSLLYDPLICICVYFL